MSIENMLSGFIINHLESARYTILNNPDGKAEQSFGSRLFTNSYLRECCKFAYTDPKVALIEDFFWRCLYDKTPPCVLAVKDSGTGNLSN